MTKYFILTHDETQEKIQVPQDELLSKLDNLCQFYQGYLLPKEIYPLLSEELKKIWDMGYRGCIRY